MKFEYNLYTFISRLV